MDSLAYSRLFHPQHRFLIGADDVASLDLASNYLNKVEEVQVAFNMFSGQPVGVGPGTSPAIISIHIVVLEPADAEWRADESDPDFPDVPGRLFDIEMLFERSELDTLRVTGQLQFFATSRDSVQLDGSTMPYFQVLGIRDLPSTGILGEMASWGRAKLAYLTNQAPAAVLNYAPVPDAIDPTFRFDASASYDPDSGLHSLPYRWHSSVTGEWSEWTVDPVMMECYSDHPGFKTVRLQVRDRWESAATTDLEVWVPYVFPDTRDKLMANFQSAYSGRDIEGYEHVVHSDFIFLLQPHDVDLHNLSEDYLDRQQELAIAQNMFSGNPVEGPDGPVPGISQIELRDLEPLTTWHMISSGEFAGASRRVYDVEIAMQRPGAGGITIEGPTDFYLSSRESTLADETVRQYWQLRGQNDQTRRPHTLVTDGIGVFFDPEATTPCLESVAPGTYGPGFMYLVITEPSAPAGIIGWECSLEFGPCLSVLDWGIQGQGINVAMPPDFTVGLSEALPWAPAVLLLDMRVEITCTDCTWIHVHPAPSTSIPGVPLYADAGDPGHLITLYPVSGGEEHPVAGINCPCAAYFGGEVHTWGAVKIMYRGVPPYWN
jgi:hypothetical protein